MRDLLANLASLATFVSSIVALLGLIQSQPWLIGFGIFFVCVSMIALIYAQRSREALRLAGINIEGRNLDSLNIANLRRRLNRSLTVNRAYHMVRTDGDDLAFAWQYDGSCRAEQETSMEFSIDTENNIPFTELECFAYDLQRDPQRLHKISPILIGSDGLSKKIAVPFLETLRSQQPFSVLLHCNLPGFVSSGVHYYTSTLSFDHRTVSQLAVHLIFVRTRPDWVRVYACDRRGRPCLAGELPPFKSDGETCEYIDLRENVPGQSARIYVFHLSTHNASLLASSKPELIEA